MTRASTSPAARRPSSTAGGRGPLNRRTTYVSRGDTQRWGPLLRVLRNAPCPEASQSFFLSLDGGYMRLLLSSSLALILAAATPLALDAAQRRGAGGGVT